MNLTIGERFNRDTASTKSFHDSAERIVMLDKRFSSGETDVRNVEFFADTKYAAKDFAVAVSLPLSSVSHVHCV